MKLTIKILSLKSLIRKLFRATIIIRVETVAEKEREIVDLTREPDIAPMPMPMPPPVPAIIRARGVDTERPQADVREPSVAPSWTMTPETEGRGATPSPAENTPREAKGKEPAYDQALLIAQLAGRESAAGPSGAAAGASSSSSSNNTKQEEPQTPPRKRRQASPDVVFVKEERDLVSYSFGGVIIDDDSRPATPVKKEESDSDSDDEDVVQISPFKKRRSNSPDLASIPAIPAAFQRSWSPSPPSPRNAAHNAAPAPSPEPFFHPDFPSRPALRCPKKQPTHNVIEAEISTSSRNYGRRYYRCRDCPGFGGFVCWADSRGVRPGNPACWCRQPSREDITGDTAQQPDTLWYKCATDACRFRRFDWDDPLSPEEVNRYCGRDVYPL
ncbi:hypothetical protein F4821DRAFT_240739 [Hypoxylon rubiginosum]|uniref:Uncharacterized protein n=1 Tax=Hypoxylon rubiginosum TaxID=110542 RepID=A0ACC0CYY4_9PEZI|nr:hypothetical protein F4821DRAFT_240739 [Hypoxylon rubiginosum]